MVTYEQKIQVILDFALEMDEDGDLDRVTRFLREEIAPPLARLSGLDYLGSFDRGLMLASFASGVEPIPIGAELSINEAGNLIPSDQGQGHPVLGRALGLSGVPPMHMVQMYER